MHGMMKGGPPMRGPAMMDESEDAEATGRNQALDQILKHVEGLIASKFAKPKVEVEVSEDDGQEPNEGEDDSELMRRLMAESGR